MEDRSSRLESPGGTAARSCGREPAKMVLNKTLSREAATVGLCLRVFTLNWNRENQCLSYSDNTAVINDEVNILSTTLVLRVSKSLVTPGHVNDRQDFERQFRRSPDRNIIRRGKREKRSNHQCSSHRAEGKRACFQGYSASDQGKDDQEHTQIRGTKGEIPDRQHRSRKADSIRELA